MTNETSSAIGIFFILFIVLLILKVTEIIDWGWWAITTPIWFPFVTIITFSIVTGALMMIFQWFQNR